MSIKTIFAFIAGAAIGSAVTWKIVKTKYEQIANEEIASVKEVFSRKAKNTESSEDKTDESDHNKKPTIQEIKSYVDMVKDSGYTNNEKKGEEVSMSGGDPYTITGDEVGTMFGYDFIDLTYYADGVVENENHEIMSDADLEDAIGLESLNTFGEYDDDVVWVRNDRQKTDYEIYRDPRKYSEVAHDSPFRSN